MLKENVDAKNNVQFESLHKYDEIASKIIYKYGSSWMLDPEYKAIVIHGLITADIKHKEDGRASKNTYRFGSWKLSKRKLNELKKTKTKRPTFSDTYIDSTKIVQNEHYDYERYEQTAKIAAEIISSEELTLEEKKYLKCIYQDGLSQSDTARKYNVTRQAVSCSVNNALKKLRGIYNV